MKISILLPIMPLDWREARPFAAIVAHSGAHRLWQGQSLLLDSYQLFAAISRDELRIPVGSAVALTPLRSPMEAAIQINTLTALTGVPLVAGFGPGGTAFQRGQRGRVYASPLTAMREYLTIVRGFLDGEEVHVTGEYFSGSGMLPPLSRGLAELGLGVLRPRMAELAGKVADVSLNWLCGPDYIDSVLMPGLGRGAEETSRDVPRTVAFAPVAVDRAGREFERLLWAGSSVHLGAPHYRDMLSRSGVDLSTSDPVVLSRRLLDAGVFLGGSMEQIKDGIARYEAAGVDELVLNAVGVASLGADAALSELVELVSELSP